MEVEGVAVRREGDDGATSSPALADVLAAPGAADVIDHRLRRRARFLPAAHELLGDGVGDDDGLCEANEDCLYTPHLGAFQGEGVIELDAEGDDGVRLFRHPVLEVPPP